MHINWLEYIASALCLAAAVLAYQYRVENGLIVALG